MAKAPVRLQLRRPLVLNIMEMVLVLRNVTNKISVREAEEGSAEAMSLIFSLI